MLALTSAFVLASASVQAQPTTPPAPQASAPVASAAPAAPEKKVCRKEQEAGSIMPKRICYTQAEWDAIDRATASDADSQLLGYRSRHSQ